MIRKELRLEWTEYENPEDLDAADRELVEAAKRVSSSAYSPYSGFSVGAALRLDDGTIVTGTNVENAAFPSGICAERTAISSAVSNFPERKTISIAVAAQNSDGITAEPVSPCGNCRQVIAEEEYRTGTPIRIILSGSKRIRIIAKSGDLLPLQFNRNSLRQAPPSQ